ncbi:uncharacterized protein LODBEIA_P30130 [Lodderomyces beijingensis]|uniref:HORMA domain-containing protein n=1 Tax=Lodderomyces beijingensis TaxID=1775926 RepID=A0ABP0ZKW9_9ASCO
MQAQQLVKQVDSTIQSQLLIHEFISVSIYCITFLRDVFRDDTYTDAKYYDVQNPLPESNYVRTKKLKQGVTSQTDSLIKCIEDGIKSAIQAEYLKAVQLGIYLNNDDKQVVESYLFAVDYKSNSVSLTTSSGTGSGLTECNHYDTVLSQMQQMIKQLLVLTQSFDLLPRNKSIFIKLLFNESCPVDYQPDGFKDISLDAATTVKVCKGDQSTSLGEIDTGRNQIQLNVFVADKGTGDAVEVDPFDFVKQTAEVNNHEGHHDNGHDEDEDIGDVPASSLHLDTYLHSDDPGQGVTQSLQDFSLEKCTCQKCHRVIDPIEYGLKRVYKRISCYQCAMGSEVNTDAGPADPALVILMKGRKLWDHLLSNCFPSEFQFFEMTKLSRNPHDKDIIRRLFNHWFQQNVLLLTKNLIIPGSGDYSAGTGQFTAMVEGITVEDEVLTKGRSYNVIFVPKVCQTLSYLSYNRNLDDVYFPTFSIRSDFASKNLTRFKSFLEVSGSAVVKDSQPSIGAITASQAQSFHVSRAQSQMKIITTHSGKNRARNTSRVAITTPPPPPPPPAEEEASKPFKRRRASPDLSPEGYGCSFADSLELLSRNSHSTVEQWAIPKVPYSAAAATREYVVPKRRKISINRQ